MVKDKFLHDSNNTSLLWDIAAIPQALKERPKVEKALLSALPYARTEESSSIKRPHKTDQVLKTTGHPVF